MDLVALFDQPFLKTIEGLLVVGLVLAVALTGVSLGIAHLWHRFRG
ncbi:MAG TPA: hypothetical protein VM889_07530 [Candidatus Thermoplasmatota archaeon]|nr:hypothetical protein [Candidatus Thermoplasmatota archaeon]